MAVLRLIRQSIGVLWRGTKTVEFEKFAAWDSGVRGGWSRTHGTQPIGYANASNLGHGHVAWRQVELVRIKAGKRFSQ